MSLPNKYSINYPRAFYCYLQNITSNIAINKVDNFPVKNITGNAKAIIGIRNLQSTDIEGAVTWIKNGNVETINFTLPLNYHISGLQFVGPANINGPTLDKIIKCVLREAVSKAHKKMINQRFNLSSGGIYTGPRLEAHNRGTVVGYNSNFPATEFCQGFINMAQILSIIRK